MSFIALLMMTLFMTALAQDSNGSSPKLSTGDIVLIVLSSLVVFASVVILLVFLIRRRRPMAPSEEYRAHVRALEKQKKRALEKAHVQTTYDNPNFNYHLQMEPYEEFASCDANAHSYPPSYATQNTERPSLPKAVHVSTGKPKRDNTNSNTRYHNDRVKASSHGSKQHSRQQPSRTRVLLPPPTYTPDEYAFNKRWAPGV